jgi:hypothetical protein
MAAKKGKKSSKAMGKKSMKKTKGGAVDAFMKYGSSPTVPTESFSLNFVKIAPPEMNFKK